jgi:hypothetical protein
VSSSGTSSDRPTQSAQSESLSDPKGPLPFAQVPAEAPGYHAFFDAPLDSANDKDKVVDSSTESVREQVGTSTGGAELVATGKDDPNGNSSAEGSQFQKRMRLVRSKKAFLDALPGLLRSDSGKWVAFADGELIRIGDSQGELYEHCLKDLSLNHDQFIVRRIVPRVPWVVELPPTR